jgi:hypothetical protein
MAWGEARVLRAASGPWVGCRGNSTDTQGGLYNAAGQLLEAILTQALFGCEDFRAETLQGLVAFGGYVLARIGWLRAVAIRFVEAIESTNGS